MITKKFKDIFIEQYIDGIYDGVEIANLQLEDYGLEIKLPSKAKMRKMHKKKYGKVKK